MEISCAEALQLLGFTPAEQDSLPPAEVIRRAFRQQALLWHPDKLGRSGSGTLLNASPGAWPPGPTSLVAGPPPSPLDHAGTTAGPASPPASGNLLGHHHNHQQQSAHQQHSQAQAAEHFKRLVSAYQVLLQGAAAGVGGSGAGSGNVQVGGGGPGVRSNVEVEAEEEQLLDELSVDLLLLEAKRLRLSDFDMVFLHQRASGGPAAVSSGAWPEAAQSVEDVWRWIRRRVERRRRRREGAGAGGTSGMNDGGVGGRDAVPAVRAKWALLSEFLADIVGMPTRPQPPIEPQLAGGRDAPDPAGSSGCAADTAAGTQGQQDEQDWAAAQAAARPSDVSAPCAAAATAATATATTGASEEAEEQAASPRRHRRRLPAGFYWRWFKRLVVARLVFFVFLQT